MKRVKITLGIAAIGGVAGAVAGGVAALVVGVLQDHRALRAMEGFLFLIGAEIGAPLGALLFPLAAWTLMRHVPFGRALAGTIAGTLVGGFVGYWAGHDASALFLAIGGGIVGFAIAAILLRLHARAGNSAGAGVV